MSYRIHIARLPTVYPLLLAAALSAQDKPDPWQPHRALRLLYAGHPESPRLTAFRTFLKQHFDKVRTISLERLSNETAADADVVIADWDRRVDAKGRAGGGRRAPTPAPAPTPMRLGADFTRPVITIGGLLTTVRPRGKLVEL